MAATIYFAAGCGPCEKARAFVARRDPRDLDFVDAQEYPGGLWRVRYESDTVQADGVQAVAHAFGHSDRFGWRALGQVMRLPGMRWALQTGADALGYGPRYVGPDDYGTCPVPS